MCEAVSGAYSPYVDAWHDLSFGTCQICLSKERPLETKSACYFNFELEQLVECLAGHEEG